MNINLGKPIAYGRTAEIYAWQNDQVLKLYYDWYELDWIEYEARIARAVHASGLPVPAAGEILRVNDRNGLVYQRVNGIPMNDMTKRKPWLGNHYARRMADLHAEMHSRIIEIDIPRQRQRLVEKISGARALSGDLQARALTALESMPDGDCLCHNDFHPGNILVTSQSEVIIDWTDATRGNPLADLARTTILCVGSAETSQTKSVIDKAYVKATHNTFIRRYFKLRPGGEAEYRGWLPIVAAARLSENIPELEQWLIAEVEKGL